MTATHNFSPRTRARFEEWLDPGVRPPRLRGEDYLSLIAESVEAIGGVFPRARVLGGSRQRAGVSGDAALPHDPSELR